MANNQAKKLFKALYISDWKTVEQIWSTTNFSTIDNKTKVEILFQSIKSKAVNYVQNAIDLKPKLSTTKCDKLFQEVLVLDINLKHSPHKLKMFKLLFNQVLKEDFLDDKMKYLTVSLGSLAFSFSQEYNSNFDIFKNLMLALQEELGIGEKLFLLKKIINLPSAAKVDILKEILSFMPCDLELLENLKEVALKEEESVNSIIQNANIKIVIQSHKPSPELNNGLSIIDTLNLYIEKIQLEQLIIKNDNQSMTKKSKL